MKNIILTVLATTIATSGITTSMEMPFPEAHAMERPSSKRKRDMSQTNLTIETLQNLSIDRTTKDLHIVADSLPGHNQLKNWLKDIYAAFPQIEDIEKKFQQLTVISQESYQDWVRDINKYFPKLEKLFVEGMLCLQRDLLEAAIADQNLTMKVIQKAPSVKKNRLDKKRRKD